MKLERQVSMDDGSHLPPICPQSYKRNSSFLIEIRSLDLKTALNSFIINKLTSLILPIHFLCDNIYNHLSYIYIYTHLTKIHIKDRNFEGFNLEKNPIMLPPYQSVIRKMLASNYPATFGTSQNRAWSNN